MDKIKLLGQNIRRYPRTPHLEGSALQEGDSTEGQVPFSHLKGKFLVVEEKLDGANSGISFSDDCELLLQSRGHFLQGGPRETQFELFKRWAYYHIYSLFDILGTQYIMYGEMLHKMHSVFYDKLPHIFCEFDIFDKKNDCFLSTKARRALIGNSPILSVPVLYTGSGLSSLKELKSFIKPSLAKSSQWELELRAQCEKYGIDFATVFQRCFKPNLSEGLYIKVETEELTLERFKWVNSQFVQTILDTNLHHSKQKDVFNLLHPSADIFSSSLSCTWESI